MVLRDSRSVLRSLVLLPMSAVLLLSACTSPDDSDDPGILTGTITGTIQDTDGHAIAGVTIRYAGAGETGAALTATTNADGQFSMPGVTVTGVSGTGVDAGNDANGPITLAIDAPTGYMDATAQVSPTAQSTGTVGGGTVFLDNFNVGIGVVKLPALASSIKGVLRNSATGAAVGGASVSLDFTGVEFTQNGSTTGVATSYDSGIFVPVPTAADGSFTLSQVYNDSCVQLAVSGYAIAGISGSAPPCPMAGAATDPNTVNLRTSNASAPVQLATVSVTAFTSSDTLPPTVASVDGVVDPTQAQARLESSVTTTFNVRFSETLQALLDTGDVYAVLGAAPNQTSARVSKAELTGGNTATITLESALPANTPVELHIAREALKDVAGNGVADAPALAYDSLSSQDLVLSFISFSSNNTIASAATVAQVRSQALPADLAYISTDALLDTVDAATTTINPALTTSSTTTAYGTSARLEQLNSSAAVAALTALKNAISTGDNRSVQAGVARVSVQVPSNASDFVVWLERGGVKLDVLFFPAVTSGGSPSNSAYVANNGPTYVITPGGASSFDLLIRSSSSSLTVQAGDEFHISSRNAAGVLGGSSTLKLSDIGRPTVALQLLDAIIAGYTSTTTGDGGGVVVPGSPSAPATVLLSITPQAADVNDDTSGYADDNWRGDAELQGLSNVALRNSDFAKGLSSGNRAIGDADGTLLFLKTSPLLGIALTEPAVSTGVAPTASGVNTQLTLTGVYNGAANEAGGTSNLLALKVGSIFQLASDANAGKATIDVTASIRDLNNTVPDAGTQALVQLRDRMPPVMTLGFYDGTDFVFQFNEAIGKSGAFVFETTDCIANINLADSDVMLEADQRTVSFAATKLGVADVNACFTLPPYAEDAYTSAALGGLTSVTPNTNPPHGAVSYTDVPDLAIDPITGLGNTWTQWTDPDKELGIGAPYFAMANIAAP
jgi:hypothetical protein